MTPKGWRPGVYGASVYLLTTGGRRATSAIPVRLVVPRYQAALNAGGARLLDSHGDTWQADRKHRAGSFGYVGTSREASTTAPIADTTDQRLYQDLREGAAAYRFDQLPDGTYTVELRFAELAAAPPATRRFDVIIGDTRVVSGVDITAEAGHLHALDKTLQVTVTGGRLDVRFVALAGTPILNAIRLTERPDLR